MTSAIRAGAFVVATAIAGFSASARAEDRPCMADAARICPDAEPGPAQLQCLKAHKDALSPACKKKVMQMKIEKMEQDELKKEELAPPPRP